MVENSLGRFLKKKPNEILSLRIIDTSCGSGSFLISAFGYLMQGLLAIYRSSATKPSKQLVEERDGLLQLSMRHKREILLKCIYGVDIDPQAVEVAQLSLYLKLLEDETTYSARHQQIEMGAALLPSLNRNHPIRAADRRVFSIAGAGLVRRRGPCWRGANSTVAARLDR
jgi:type II restriction/modification system DNA methylase subunit YeeA